MGLRALLHSFDDPGRDPGHDGAGRNVLTDDRSCRHHGTIALAPHEGPGTTIRLTLPIGGPSNPI